ncbi:MAG: HAD-IIB family hydrolase [Planctomycetia bacterium]|nr:HAD-IIB family hydrolase [Planctomycetia bacterium]
MRFHALACDYDGTLALRGRVDEKTLAALERLLATGRKLLLVTGRELDDLLTVFPDLHYFSWVVAENGALLYCPATREEKLLCPAPPAEFSEALRRRGVTNFRTGRSIVATWRPHEVEALQAIQELGLELQVIFNKDAVMVLPTGVNKATGLTAVLGPLGLSPHEIVAVGDAENDHAFLSLCECSVAVANALPALKERADVVTVGDHGDGVIELIEQLIDNDLTAWEPQLTRHHLLFGHARDGSEVRLPPAGISLMIAGPSGSGKSTAATSFIERLAEQRYQYCIIDPEGDYDNLAGAVTVGGPQRSPDADEVMQLLAKAEQHVVVNLVGMAIADRPPFFLSLLPRLQEMRAQTGRPHWLIVDEAHHLLPASWEPGPLVMPGELKCVLYITVHPNQVAPAVLAGVDAVLAVGAEPQETVQQFLKAQDQARPGLPAEELQAGEVFLWWRAQERGPVVVRPLPSQTERRRHIRKYAEGELPPDRSFYFRGPEGKLNLRAQNLILFMQLADGVDDETWEFHLRAGDYSTWFRERIKNARMADEAVEIEQQTGVPASESRALIRALIERYYTLPAAPPLPMPGTDAAPSRQPTAEK